MAREATSRVRALAVSVVSHAVRPQSHLLNLSSLQATPVARVRASTKYESASAHWRPSMQKEGAFEDTCSQGFKFVIPVPS